MTDESGMPESYREQVKQITREVLLEYETKLNAWLARQTLDGTLAKHETYQEFIEATLKDKPNESD